ncbi:MAG: YcgN family cysteine cluster protein [Lamprobacter sp.]|uniref:YcgN family cysteine cluster protein n=1 Tax=Lamprobacter sp. TaxID=3100796 RepID=UPI002B25CBB3|nr:YcgN family cysteine cluster protein [Lamprobacter sp.]MEA3638842.1 YcgN family cysteine cluster protein [Lamprobacter sp.]
MTSINQTSPMAKPASAIGAFWECIPLNQLSAAQWESLCDGCAKCCVTKYEDEDSGTIHYTDVACHLLDQDQCRCGDYPKRSERVPDCVTLSPKTLANPYWLPETCAYRLVAEGKPLPDWHPLVCGDADAVHRLGQSVRGRVESETTAGDPLMRLISWIR